MSTVPRVPSAVPGQPPAFHTVLAHAPAIQQTFAALYADFWMDPALSQRDRELARIRNARVTACGFCRQVRFSLAREEGLDEATLDLVTDAYAESSLSDREKRILAWTDAIIGDPDRADPALGEALRRDLGEAGLAALTLGVGLFLGLARVLITLGLEPEQMPVTVLPTPGSAAYRAPAAR
ncbi:MAG: carboxymuconolactone decarboxylase family protein [Tepidiforma sp.]